jgi:sortase A
MRRAARLLGTLMVLGGVLTLGWAVLVWQWQDPFTAAYTHWEQGRLERQLDLKMNEFHPLEEPAAAASAARESPAAMRVEVAKEAARYRAGLHAGDPIGRITIGRIGLSIVVVQGTDDATLKKGPGHYAPSALPGQGQLIYIAGHRTTYLAPFSHIDAIRPGDYVTLALPYATFKYVVTRHRIVPATDLSVLKSPGHEVLILQACHPRFFATHRYLVYAKPVSITPRGGTSYALDSNRVAASAQSGR